MASIIRVMIIIIDFLSPHLMRQTFCNRNKRWEEIVQRFDLCQLRLKKDGKM